MFLFFKRFGLPRSGYDVSKFSLHTTSLEEVAIDWPRSKTTTTNSSHTKHITVHADVRSSIFCFSLDCTRRICLLLLDRRCRFDNARHLCLRLAGRRNDSRRLCSPGRGALGRLTRQAASVRNLGYRLLQMFLLRFGPPRSMYDISNVK